jgi:hypothetical protein
MEAAMDASPSLERMPAASEIEATRLDAAPAEEESLSFQAEAMPEPATEPAEDVEFELEGTNEGAIEYAEIPESELLSLEAFLRQDAAPDSRSKRRSRLRRATKRWRCPSRHLRPASPSTNTSRSSRKKRARWTRPKRGPCWRCRPSRLPRSWKRKPNWRWLGAPEIEAAGEDAPELEQAVEAEDSAMRREADAGLEADAVLAGMIAAYPGADAVEGEAESADAQDAPLEVTLSEDFYGLSEAELEAMTAPDAAQDTSAPVEADGFAGLPSISELPAWAGSEAEAVMAETAPPAPEPSFEAEREAIAQAEADARAEANASKPSAPKPKRAKPNVPKPNAPKPNASEAERAEAERAEAERARSRTRRSRTRRSRTRRSRARRSRTC